VLLVKTVKRLATTIPIAPLAARFKPDLKKSFDEVKANDAENRSADGLMSHVNALLQNFEDFTGIVRKWSSAKNIGAASAPAETAVKEARTFIKKMSWGAKDGALILETLTRERHAVDCVRCCLTDELRACCEH